jgi:hypothetical protein
MHHQVVLQCSAIRVIMYIDAFINILLEYALV